MQSCFPLGLKEVLLEATGESRSASKEYFADFRKAGLGSQSKPFQDIPAVRSSRTTAHFDESRSTVFELFTPGVSGVSTSVVLLNPSHSRGGCD